MHIFYIEKENLLCLRDIGNKDGLYKEFKIRKRRHGFRSICAPKKCLKRIQQKFNHILSDCYKANNEVHGYVKNKSIVSNAKQHIGKNIILNLDIKNFFDSITAPRIKDLFSAEPMNLNENWADILTEIFTYNNRLPQGAPTSPILSNMVCKELDDNLSKYAKDGEYIYTRYADDLTFSTDKEKITEEEILEIKKIISAAGFMVNEEKVKVKRHSTHQEVTGLTVNSKLSVRRSYIKNVRAILHNWKIKGINIAIQKYGSKYYKNRNTNCFVHSIRGKIEYVGMVRGKDDHLYLKMLLEYYKLLCKEGKNFHSHPYPHNKKSLV